MSDFAAESWDDRYRNNQDRWDLGCPAPPLINLLASAQSPQPGRMAVLGCGKGQDAMLFSTAGFDVIGFDFARTAIEYAQATAQARALTTQFLQRNIFELETAFFQEFDYVLEHNCFCTIDPTLRSRYVEVVKNLLRPEGQLIALFLTHHHSDVPPFSINPQAILELFAPDFDVILFKAAKDSIVSRRGKEHLGIFQVRAT